MRDKLMALVRSVMPFDRRRAGSPPMDRGRRHDDEHVAFRALVREQQRRLAVIDLRIDGQRGQR